MKNFAKEHRIHVHGTTDVWVLRFGRVYLTFQREKGVYGLPDTTSYTFRVWWS